MMSFQQGAGLGLILLCLSAGSCTRPDQMGSALQVRVDGLDAGLRIRINNNETSTASEVTYDHDLDTLTAEAAPGMDSYEWFAGTTYLGAFSGQRQVSLAIDEPLVQGGYTYLTLVVTRDGVAASASCLLIDENT